MSDFSIYFKHPWFLLLLIPAFLLTLIPYFKIAKRYRRTRNRIVSMILHITVFVLAIALFSGMEFRYSIPNNENELIILVDVSETEEQSAETRDTFVEYVIEDSVSEGLKIGVVTFGFDHKYAVPLTHDVEKVYNSYLTAELPDTSATNMASALRYAKGLFENPETSKILIVTDGKETDENAREEIGSIIAQGTKVDVAYIPSSFEGGFDAQFIGSELPDYHVNLNENCTIKVTVRSQAETVATIEMYDNDTKVGEQTVNLLGKTQTFAFEHHFETEGLHKLTFKMDAEDLLEQNNVYTTYMYLEMYKNILILDRDAITGVDQGASENLIKLINNEDNEVPYTVSVVNVADAPQTVNKLRMYDQVILNNIAKADMPDGFIELLESYVSEYGGGLITFGGENEAGEANMYERNDLFGSLYQEMLPVEAIEYTPPVGVVFIIDRSGSMGSNVKDSTALEVAVASAQASLAALSERDYIGIVTMDTVPEIVLDMTPRSQERVIRAAIESVNESMGSTVLSGSLRAARDMLGRYAVDRKHIILISDGGIASDDVDYLDYAKSMYKEQGITISCLAVGEMGSAQREIMQNIVIAGNPEDVDLDLLYAEPKSPQAATTAVQAQLNTEAIKAVNYKTFNPNIYGSSLSSPIVQNLDRGTNDEGKIDYSKLTMEIDGFYGTRVKKGADLILVGEYNVPIYAQWKYGNGMVGSFMCDVRGKDGDFSAKLMTDANAGKFFRNAINGLMPTESIRPELISYELEEGNYFNKLNVYGNLEKGETIVGEIVYTEDNVETRVSLNSLSEEDTSNLPVYVTVPLSKQNNYSRCEFIVRDGGVYKLVLKKCGEDGSVIVEDDSNVEVSVYKSFSYSSEYDVFKNEEEEQIKENLEYIVKAGEGAIIEDLEDPVEVFSGFKTEIHKTFDPRMLFAIIMIIAFLLDVAVRKFKFKWPHEIIRDYKMKKGLK
ncbi:MAG: VWA domain-containing protein [Clostridia bacterium]|nr:VWA domain-containing protein [Clostridia bacterium]